MTHIERENLRKDILDIVADLLIIENALSSSNVDLDSICKKLQKTFDL